MKRLFLILLVFFNFCLARSQSQIDTIKVGYTNAPPFILGEENTLQGVNIWLWDRVCQDLNIPYTFVPMDFSDMLEALEQGEIDVCVNPLTITGQRNKKMEFTHAFFASNSSIVVAEQSAIEKFTQFITSFFNINFLRGMLVLFVIILFFGILAWLFERNRNPEHFRYGFKGIWDGAWWAAVTLTTVGYGDKAPMSKKGKATALLLMFVGLLFISGLTASIASSLTVNELNKNPDSFNQFKEKSVGTITNSGTAQFLKERFFKEVRTYPSVSEGLIDLQQGRISAFIYDEPILRYRIFKDKRFKNLQLLPIQFDVQFYAFGIAKDNQELAVLVSQRILEIMETQEWELILTEFGLSEI